MTRAAGVLHSRAEALINLAYALNYQVPGLSAPLLGLRPDLPVLSASLSGRHVPPLRERDRWPLQGQDAPPLDIYIFSGLDAGLQPDTIEPHSNTAVPKTTPALTSPAG